MVIIGYVSLIDGYWMLFMVMDCDWLLSILMDCYHWIRIFNNVIKKKWLHFSMLHIEKEASTAKGAAHWEVTLLDNLQLYILATAEC